MLVITLVVVDRSKPGVDKLSGLFLSGGSFGINWFGNLESAEPGEGDTMGKSEGIIVGNKLGIYYGEVLGITLGVVDRRKLGGDECSGQVLSGGKVEGRSLVEFLWVEVFFCLQLRV